MVGGWWDGWVSINSSVLVASIKTISHSKGLSMCLEEPMSVCRGR